MNIEKSDISEVEFISLIAMLMALVALSINMILPGFQSMTDDFSLPTPNKIGLSVSLLYAGLALGQVLFGSLSDGTGRKMAINIGLLIFIVGALLSYASGSFPLFIAGQIIQGIGLGAPRVVTIAIVRDKFEGPQMARIMSFVMVIFVFIPMVSPYLGQLIIQKFGWRSLFLVFTAAAILMSVWLNFRLGETHRKADRSTLTLSVFFGNFIEVISSPPAMLHAATLGVCSGAFITYLNMSQQILQFQYGLGTQYPLYFAFMSCGIAVASFMNGRAVVTIGMERLTIAALLIMASLSICLAIGIAASGRDPSIMLLLSYLIIMLFSFGILVSNLNAMAMRSLGNVAGMGTAIVGALSTFLSVPLAIWIGNFYAGSVQPLVLAFGVLASFGVCLCTAAIRLSVESPHDMKAK